MTPQHFLELLLVNVENVELGDEEFRHFVINTLPLVEGYNDAMLVLKQLGKMPEKMPYQDEKPRAEWLAGKLAEGLKEGDLDNHQDRPSQPFSER